MHLEAWRAPQHWDSFHRKDIYIDNSKSCSLLIKLLMSRCHQVPLKDAAAIPLQTNRDSSGNKLSAPTFKCEMTSGFSASLCKLDDEFPAQDLMSDLCCITFREGASPCYILSSRPPSEEAQIKYTFSLNKIGHAVSAPIKCREKKKIKKTTVNCRAAVYGAARDN